MKKVYLSLVLTVMSFVVSYAQVSGTKTIGVDYPTLAAAVNALNTAGITGNVVINVPAGYTETAPTGGYLLGSVALNNSVNATNTLIIKKNGAGANPLLTAQVGTGIADGIFGIAGTDYVTIDGISLQEAAANTTGTTQMEVGYGLVKRQNVSPFDGCQFVTIKNCTITLSQANNAIGIYGGNNVPGDLTPLTITATTDAMNNCTFTGNTITNVNTGIYLVGYTAAAAPYNLYDQNNTIGGTTAALGNTITNFGGTSAAAYGIYLAGQNNDVAQYNTITSATVPGTGTVYALYHGVGNNSSLTVNNNTIQMTASTGAIYGITNGNGAANSGLSGTGNLVVNNNIFQNYSFTTANTALSYFCLYNQGGTTSGWPMGSVIQKNNIVQNMTALNSTGTIYLFYNYYCSTNDIRFNNNKINNIFRSTASGSTYVNYTWYGNPTGGADSTVGNKISNVSSPSVLYNLYIYTNGLQIRDKVIMYDTLINDTALNSTFYGIYAFYGNNAKISNNYLANLYAGGTNTMYNIYSGSYNTGILSNNTILNNSSYTMYGMYSGSSLLSVQMYNNLQSGCTTGAGTYYGYYFSTSGAADVYNNVFTNHTSTSTGSFYCVYITGGAGINVHDNTISNITSLGGTIYGEYHSSGTNFTVYNNTWYNLTNTGGTVYGLYNGTGTLVNIYNNNWGKITNLGAASGNAYGPYLVSGTTVNFYQNTVDSVTSLGTSSLAYGLYESGPGTFNCYKNKISYISGNGTGSTGEGMYLNSGTVTAYNNLVGNILTPAYNGSGGTQCVGIYVGAATLCNLYYNTVVMSGTSSGAAFGSCAVFASTTPTVTFRNNIFINNSTPTGAGVCAAYRRSSTTFTTYSAQSNNNLFYAGTPAANKPLYYDGTTAYQTLATYKAYSGAADNLSVTENTTFQNLVGIGADFLRPSTSVATQVESEGVNITGITDDYAGTVRAGNAGYTGTGGCATDLGAYEGNYIVSDLSPANLTFTALLSACTTGDRTFSVTISDAIGVPTTGALVPRVYFKKGAGTWFSAPGVLASGSSVCGTWNFTIPAATVGGLVVGDVISYYVIAQDNAGTPNIGSNPSTGLVATNVNSVTTNPTTPFTYTVLPSMSGIINVGVGQTYATITAAAAAYNTSCISGNVVFQLMDAAYPSETFPITFNTNAGANASNTLTIRPAAGVAVAINGLAASTAIFKLLNASYITIDGVNTGGSSLTLNGTNTGTFTDIWLASTPITGPGCSNITLKNMNINGGSNATTVDWCILAAVDAATPTTTAGLNNDNITITGNTFTKCGYGIYANGTTAFSAGGLDNWVISNNTFGPSAYNATANFGYNGMFLQNMLNPVISGNLLQNIGLTTSSSQVVGIYMPANITGATVTQNTINGIFANNAGNTLTNTCGLYVGTNVINSNFTRNILTNISGINTGGYAARGMIIATNNNTSNDLFANNMVSNIYGQAWTIMSESPEGITLEGATGGLQFYYNTVNMNTQYAGVNQATYSAAFFNNSSGTNIDVRNNIFLNSYDNTTSGTDKGYAVYSTAPASSYSFFDYNDFYVSGPNIIGYLGGDQVTFAAFNAALGGPTHNINVNPSFIAPGDLHLGMFAANLPLATGTPLTVTNDFDGTVRSGTTPVMGAHEVNLSQIPPTMVYTALPNTCSTGDITLSATIGDIFTGVPTTGANVPRIYFRKNSGAWVLQPWCSCFRQRNERRLELYHFIRNAWRNSGRQYYTVLYHFANKRRLYRFQPCVWISCL